MRRCWIVILKCLGIRQNVLPIPFIYNKLLALSAWLNFISHLCCILRFTCTWIFFFFFFLVHRLFWKVLRFFKIKQYQHRQQLEQIVLRDVPPVNELCLWKELSFWLKCTVWEGSQRSLLRNVSGLQSWQLTWGCRRELQLVPSLDTPAMCGHLHKTALFGGIKNNTSSLPR